MKRRISLFICVLTTLLLVMTAGVAAVTYEPDSYGTYTVGLGMDANSEYVMIVLKGEYDQTNYIEAYNNADDSEILYFEQKASDAEGNVSFGPFVPNGYFDATVIVGGTNLDEPYLAGYLSAEGISNSASIEIFGIEKEYTVEGVDGEDCVVEIQTEVLDTFGFPSVTGEEVSIKLINNLEDVTVDGNILTISKTAKAQAFTVYASAGDATETVYVQIKRNEPVYKSIVVYDDEQYKNSTNTISVVGIVNSFPEISVYAKTFDQYNDEIEDTHTFVYGSKTVGNTFTPIAGTVVLKVISSDSSVVKDVVINASARPDYKGSALELYELIASCRERIAEQVNISSESGDDIYPGELWTTAAAVSNFDAAISVASFALGSYGLENFGDDNFADEVAVLKSALDDYNDSFKDGKRIDVTSISIDTQNAITVINGKVELDTTVVPKLPLTTDVLSWSSSDESVATVDENGVVTAKASGKATITVTTRAGLTDSMEVTVIKKATQVMLSPSSATATYGSDTVAFKAQISPKDSTDVIEWTVANPDIADLEIKEYVEGSYRVVEATVVPKSAGKTKITVNALYGEKSKASELTVVMPAWDTVSAPSASIEPGSVYAGTRVVLETETENATIYYTLDGTTPSKTNGRIYKTPIAVNQSLTLKAVAVADSMYDSDVVTYEYRVVDTKVELSNAIVRPAFDTVIDLSVWDFEDVKIATFTFEYDTNSIYDVNLNNNYLADHDITVEGSRVENSGTLTVTLSKEGGFSFNGKIAEIWVVADENAQEGECTVRITDVVVEKIDGSFVETAAIDSVVTVCNYIIGDANDDGKISLADVLIIKQYLAENETAKKNILLDAADTDGDGDVDSDDVILLSKYCVGWDVEINQRHGTGLLPD